MPTLLSELIFVETDSTGNEFYRSFPVGTPCDGVMGTPSEEAAICQSRIVDYERKGERNLRVMSLGGRPRILHRRFFDPLFNDQVSGEPTKSIKRDNSTSVEQKKTTVGNSAGMANRNHVRGTGIISPRTTDVFGTNDVRQSGTLINVAESRNERIEILPGVGFRCGDEIESNSGRVNYANVVIVDFLNLLVRAYHAGPPSKINGVRSLLSTIANVIERLSPEYLLFALDGGHDERSELYPAYKSHRPPKPTELVAQIELAEQAISAIGWPMIRVNGWEADDVIASLVTQIHPTATGVVVCSCDKDLLQLCSSTPAKIYHPWSEGSWIGGKQVEEKYQVKRNQFGDYLSLVGDASDGVPGVSGIGPKKAAELLGKYANLESILEAARCLLIPGAAGQKLRDQADAARLSRKLVTLKESLVIPTEWHGYEATSPNAGWVEALRSMDLGQAANRLVDLLPTTGRIRTGSSLIEVSPVQRTLSKDDRHDRNQVCGDSRIPAESRVDGIVSENGVSAGDSAMGGSHAAMLDRIATAPRTMGVLDGCGAGQNQRDCSDPEWIETEPFLGQLPKSASLADQCRSVYANACRMREKFLARDDGRNSWKRGTEFWFVEELALDQLPFRMPTTSDLTTQTITRFGNETTDQQYLKSVDQELRSKNSNVKTLF